VADEDDLNDSAIDVVPDIIYYDNNKRFISNNDASFTKQGTANKIVKIIIP
ncbi:5533_t:CDS:1, partial [Entrophospora sp. SA101]